MDSSTVVGRRVSHIQGGSGTIREDLGVSQFSGLHFYRVKWDEPGRQAEAAAQELKCEEVLLSDVLAEIKRVRQEEERRRRERQAEIERVRQEKERRRREQQERKSQVERLLTQFDFEAADRLYSDCEPWWPSHEYQRLRAHAIRLNKFIPVYCRASLAELDAHYNNERVGDLTTDDLAQLKLPKLEMKLARLGMPLDHEQLLACARPEKHRLIRARAGSGKTRTLAALAALSIHDEELNPDQVLILAFNKKAAVEIGDRVRDAAGIDGFRGARTFHSLAYQLADHAGRNLLFDDGNLGSSRRAQSGFMERLIPKLMNPAFRESLYAFFRRELEQLDQLGANLSEVEYVAFRRAMRDYTLNGDNVKSIGEKFIADFLFEHDIKYAYERVWSWQVQDRLYGAPYRPDFSITHAGHDFILEHWAVDPDDPFAQVPDWLDTTTTEYREQIQAKRRFWSTRNVELLETHTGMLRRGREAFERRLTAQLEHAGIRCQKLPPETLHSRVVDAPRNVSRMAELFLDFIKRAKKRGWTVEDVAQIVRDTPDSEPRNRAFHQLAIHAYAAYEQALGNNNSMDFDDLLISAAECVNRQGGAARIHLGRGASIAVSELRWILIDEFQDFSELYYRLIREILNANPSARVVAVGDDWQAINGFAGAQLIFFNDFSQCFPGAGAATISKNRRSGRVIVGAGNHLMAGKGAPARAHHGFAGDIRVVATDQTRVAPGAKALEVATTVHRDGRQQKIYELAKALQACADVIGDSVYADNDQQRWVPSVLILSRAGYAYGSTLREFGRFLEPVLRAHPKLQELANQFVVVGGDQKNTPDGAARIEVMTAHKAKGKEADTVIVLEATTKQFPKIHADNQLFRLFGVGTEDVLAEERRLFYVAITRAEHRLALLTQTKQESPYLADVMEHHLADIGTEFDGHWQLGATAQSLKTHLEQMNQVLLIRQNVSRQAVSALDRIVADDLGLPQIGFSPGQGLHAELAWPEHKPPIAILTGRFSAQADLWRKLGWEVEAP